MENIIIEKQNNITKFTFNKIPTSLEELKTFDQNYFKVPEYACAMFVAILTNFDKNKLKTYKMIDYINGPNEVTEYQKVKMNGTKPFIFILQVSHEQQSFSDHPTNS